MKINEKNLVAFSVAPTVVQREGCLLKRGEVNRAFQKRWFVLKGNLLFYFEKQNDKEPLGIIIMEGCTIELAECEEQVCSFRVIFPAREYMLAADNQENLEAWMKCLARASYTYLKMMVSELEMQLQQLNACGGASSQDGDSPLSPAARQRLNPFNTPEENKNFAQQWEERNGCTSDGGPEPCPVTRPRSNTVSGGSSKHPTTSTTTVWHDNALPSRPAPIVPSRPAPMIPSRPAPIPPKRIKKKSPSTAGLSAPPNKAVHKSDSAASCLSILSTNSNTSSSSSTGAFSSLRQYFPFSQLHMDYGAAILRDRELHMIQTGRSGTTATVVVRCQDAVSCATEARTHQAAAPPAAHTHSRVSAGSDATVHQILADLSVEELKPDIRITASQQQCSPDLLHF